MRDPLVVRGSDLGQRERREDGPCPDAEILRGHLFARDLTQISVDVIGSDRPQLALIVAIFEELLPR